MKLKSLSSSPVYVVLWWVEVMYVSPDLVSWTSRKGSLPFCSVSKVNLMLACRVLMYS